MNTPPDVATEHVPMERFIDDIYQKLLQREKPVMLAPELQSLLEQKGISLKEFRRRVGMKKEKVFIRHNRVILNENFLNPTNPSGLDSASLRSEKTEEANEKRYMQNLIGEIEKLLEEYERSGTPAILPTSHVILPDFPEDLRCPSTVPDVKNPLLHISYENLQEFLEYINEYDDHNLWILDDGICLADTVEISEQMLELRRYCRSIQHISDEERFVLQNLLSNRSTIRKESEDCNTKELHKALNATRLHRAVYYVGTHPEAIEIQFAINTISHREGISKNESRELLNSAIEKGYLCIERDEYIGATMMAYSLVGHVQNTYAEAKTKKTKRSVVLEMVQNTPTDEQRKQKMEIEHGRKKALETLSLLYMLQRTNATGRLCRENDITILYGIDASEVQLLRDAGLLGLTGGKNGWIRVTTKGSAVISQHPEMLHGLGPVFRGYTLAGAGIKVEEKKKAETANKE